MQVVGAGDFEVPGLAGHDENRLAQTLDELGVVGAGEVGLGIRPAEEGGLEDLGGLDADEVGTVYGLEDSAPQGFGRGGVAEDGREGVRLAGGDEGGIDALEGVGDVDAGDDGGVPVAGRIKDALDEAGAGAGSGGVVDRDMGAGFGDEFQGVLDGLVAVVWAALAEADAEEAEFVGVAELELGVSAVIGGAGDDDEGDVGVVGEQLDGPVQEGPPAEVFVEFGAGRVESFGVAPAGTGGREDDGNLHGEEYAGERSNMATPEREVTPSTLLSTPRYSPRMEMTPRRWAYTSAYISGLFGDQDGLLRWVREEALTRGLPDIALPAESGRLLKLMTELAGQHAVARGRTPLVIEVGTLAGYSALWIVRGLAAVGGGRLITIERDPAHAAAARETFARAGLQSLVELREGGAIGVLTALGAELGPGAADLVFLDADKREYPDYWELVRPLLAVGGVLVADNALGSSDWWIDEPLGVNEARDAADRFNRLIASDGEFESVIVPLRHGLVLARRKR